MRNSSRNLECQNNKNIHTIFLTYFTYNLHFNEQEPEVVLKATISSGSSRINNKEQQIRLKLATNKKV
jgi:hypothetical protein